MNLRQVMQPKSSANGFGRQRVEREMGTKLENKVQSGKFESRRFTNAGELAGSRGGVCGSPSRDRLVYLTACLVGHDVEVQVKNGSIYSGIFHATNAEQDFGIILKMARLIKDGSLRGQKATSESVSKAPSKILIIPAKELVQLMAKDVSVTMDGLTNELHQEKQQELMLDSFISQTRRAEGERELERWVPDEDDPRCPELENIFDDPWNRSWNQFETNEALFGVKSTFDEELYTTKLERGPQMRELEREAIRIAREIEGEETHDFHLAEERGIHLHQNFDLDEEMRYSSVLRRADDSGYEDSEATGVDSHNAETFGDSSSSTISRSFSDLRSGKSNGVTQVSSSTSSADEGQSSQSSTGRDLYQSNSSDLARQLATDLLSKTFHALDGESRIHEDEFDEHHGVNNNTMDSAEKQTSAVEAQQSALEDPQSQLNTKKDASDKGGLSPNATAYAPSSSVSSKGQEKMSSPGEFSEGGVVGKTQGVTQSGNSRGRPGSSTSSTSECVGAASASSGPTLSPSSSMGSLSSEKSSLNPHAKEFKLNPNAKSFIPSQTSLRPQSPVSDGSFYFPANVPPVPHMHGMPLGFGVGPSFAGQHVMLNPPAAAPMQAPQAYFHSNGPQYGQQMIVGHPRPVLYMPSYPPEMPYKGREF